MSLPYFYEPAISINTTTFTVSEETSKHCIQVLRMKKNELLQLTDGKGNIYTASITEADKKHCIVNIQQHRYINVSTKKVCIAISLVKNASRFEWFLEKATELGIHEIIPLICKRTEKQHFRFDRMNHILISAMLQSQQTWLPILHEPQKISDVIHSSNHPQKLIAHCIEEDKKSVTDLEIENNCLMLIGPEGDFTKEEIDAALLEKYIPVSLGNTRLRTETAGIVAATILINF